MKPIEIHDASLVLNIIMVPKNSLDKDMSIATPPGHYRADDIYFSRSHLTEMSAPPFAIGDRVQVDKKNASVRYVGSIDGQDGTWVGLEWEDKSRGKHDGSHSGRTCENARMSTLHASKICQSVVTLFIVHHLLLYVYHRSVTLV